MHQFFLTRKFRASQIVIAAETLTDNKGEIYLHEGEEARVMMCDPEKYPDRPYGLRKPEEHITRNFFAEKQLLPHPDHPKGDDEWERHAEKKRLAMLAEG